MTFWPFVSRERMLDAITLRDSEITRLLEQIADLTRERKRLTDFIAVRSNGLSIYDEYKTAPEPVEPTPSTEPEIVEPPITRARSFAKQVERNNRKEFTQKELEAQAAINQMIEQGQKAAEKAASAN